MAQNFGQETRQATQDANAGVVSKDRQTTEVRRANLGQRTSVSFNKDGNSELGAAVAKFAEAGFQEAASRKKQADFLEGQRRVAEGEALDVIAGEQNTVLKYLFGKDATYRGAQQRSIESDMTERAIRDVEKAEEYAKMDPFDYTAMRREEENELRKKYAGDPETLALITLKLADREAITSKAYHLNREEYVQEENFNANVHYLRNELKLAEMDSKSPDPELKANYGRLVQGVKDGSFYNRTESGPQMDRAAQIQATVTLAVEGLIDGSKTGFNLLKDAGMMEELQPEQLDAVRKAETVHVRKHNRQRMWEVIALEKIASTPGKLGVLLSHFETMRREYGNDWQTPDEKRLINMQMEAERKQGVQSDLVEKYLLGDVSASKNFTSDIATQGFRQLIEQTVGPKEDGTPYTDKEIETLRPQFATELAGIASRSGKLPDNMVAGWKQGITHILPDTEIPGKYIMPQADYEKFLAMREEMTIYAAEAPKQFARAMGAEDLAKFNYMTNIVGMYGSGEQDREAFANDMRAYTKSVQDPKVTKLKATETTKYQTDTEDAILKELGRDSFWGNLFGTSPDLRNPEAVTQFVRQNWDTYMGIYGNPEKANPALVAAFVASSSSFHDSVVPFGAELERELGVSAMEEIEIGFGSKYWKKVAADYEIPTGPDAKYSINYEPGAPKFELSWGEGGYTETTSVPIQLYKQMIGSERAAAQEKLKADNLAAYDKHNQPATVPDFSGLNAL